MTLPRPYLHWQMTLFSKKNRAYKYVIFSAAWNENHESINWSHAFFSFKYSYSKVTKGTKKFFVQFFRFQDMIDFQQSHFKLLSINNKKVIFVQVVLLSSMQYFASWAKVSKLSSNCSLDCAIFQTNMRKLFPKFINWARWVNSGKLTNNWYTITCQFYGSNE